MNTPGLPRIGLPSRAAVSESDVRAVLTGNQREAVALLHEYETLPQSLNETFSQLSTFEKLYEITSSLSAIFSTTRDHQSPERPEVTREMRTPILPVWRAFLVMLFDSAICVRINNPEIDKWRDPSAKLAILIEPLSDVIPEGELKPFRDLLVVVRRLIAELPEQAAKTNLEGIQASLRKKNHAYSPDLIKIGRTVVDTVRFMISLAWRGRHRD